jgi:hypothetical protein
MTATPASGPTDGPAAAVAVRRAPMALVTGAFVLLVLLVVVVLLVVKVTRGTTAAVAPPVTPAPASIVAAAATVPAVAFDTVGAPAPEGPGPVVLSRQPPLVIGGKAAVVYVGSEFCPYCAAVRWPLVVALSRFGTFDHLGATSSSGNEVFPGLQTFSFDGATYRSRYVSLSAVEEYGPALSTTWPDGFAPLENPTALDQTLMRHYASAPSAPAGSGRATLPFIDIGNRVLVEGADIGFSPGALQSVSMAQIASDLSEPTSPVAEAVIGMANELTAAICASTGEAPAKVCRSPGVRAGATTLGL